MQKQFDKLIISTQEFYHLVNISDILYCCSNNSYTTFYVKDVGKVTVSVSIKKVEERLKDYHFIRPHQSYLVNADYIQSITRKREIKIHISGDITIPVSKRMKKCFLKNLENMYHFQIP
jgi:two-component system, LytTR family, response regulator